MLDENAFDGYMGMLEWKMPYNMAAYHFNSSEIPPVSKNPAYHAKPLIEVDLDELFAERKGVRLIRSDKTTVPIQRLGGGFVIVETNDS